MVKWLQEAAYQLSGSNNEYRPCTLYKIFLDRDDKKIPGVVLFKAGEHYPLMAVGVGFAEPLDKLFYDAERIMKGSWGRTALVIIVKVSGSKQHTKDESPWGLASDHATLHKLYLDNKLDLKIEAYYDKKGLNIISDLEAKYNCKSVEATSDKSPAITINGRSFDLPIKDLHEALRKGKADEKTRRIYRMIQRIGAMAKES
ncbi:uncharacterized protein ASPGLDRAFT_1514185 [Aspergillus glaucus CBS 516.65]|uniref:Uncharacterized protein n=1 Tax=Aspergillus glaucus CBS 516.65 TaxID=1160497 RepID=A0A1L9VNT4_ASPGL|nr:hypothetical protein ASPGLDRAFT_1514185 [Aspergillus glaucus CBS 516.65]OJJ85540.1 hypothetical protein ASPGLDRAFT_1514185 [Aspergillus glaucus CBS 516.65]